MFEISGEVFSGGERGLPSVAFAPDFRRSGRFYVDYTDPDDNTRVVEYASPSGRRVDNRASGLIQSRSSRASAPTPEAGRTYATSLGGSAFRLEPKG